MLFLLFGILALIDDSGVSMSAYVLFVKMSEWVFMFMYFVLCWWFIMGLHVNSFCFCSYQTWEKRGVSGIGERNYFGFLFFGSHGSILNSII